MWLIRRDVFFSGFCFKDSVLLSKQSFCELIVCLFIIRHVAQVVVVSYICPFYCIVERCRGEGTAPSQTGHVTISNKGPVATYTCTGICSTGFLVVPTGVSSLRRQSHRWFQSDFFSVSFFNFVTRIEARHTDCSPVKPFLHWINGRHFCSSAVNNRLFVVCCSMQMDLWTFLYECGCSAMDVSIVFVCTCISSLSGSWSVRSDMFIVCVCVCSQWCVSESQLENGSKQIVSFSCLQLHDKNIRDMPRDFRCVLVVFLWVCENVRPICLETLICL